MTDAEEIEELIRRNTVLLPPAAHSAMCEWCLEATSQFSDELLIEVTRFFVVIIGARMVGNLELLSDEMMNDVTKRVLKLMLESAKL